MSVARVPNYGQEIKLTGVDLADFLEPSRSEVLPNLLPHEEDPLRETSDQKRGLEAFGLLQQPRGVGRQVLGGQLPVPKKLRGGDPLEELGASVGKGEKVSRAEVAGDLQQNLFRQVLDPATVVRVTSISELPPGLHLAASFHERQHGRSPARDYSLFSEV